MVGLIDVKWIGGASVWYWVNYVTLTFDLTRGIDFWFFKFKFQNSCTSGIFIWLIWLYGCMVLPFDNTHELNLVVSRSMFEIALFEE